MMENVSDTGSTAAVESESVPASDIALFKSGGSASSAAPTGEVAATPAAQRDESGRFTSKADAATDVVADAGKAADLKTDATTTATAAVDTGAKPAQKDSVSALIAMRTRLQAAENRVRELEAGKQPESPDIFTDPDKAVQTLVEKQVAPIRMKFFNQSVQTAEGKYTDFGDAYENFTALIDSGNQALLAQLRQHEDPGEFIYLIGSNTPEFRQQREAKYNETLSAKDAEIAALKAKLATAEATQAARADVPESLNRQPSGAVPARDSDAMDITKIVRFKSG